LTNYLKLNTLDEQSFIMLFKKIMEAINYLHENEIVHMDIKLDNIMVDKFRNPKLIDFGFSIMNKDAKVQLMCGTPSYMSPEILGNNNIISTQTDIWSAGVVLYKMLFRKYPFIGVNNKELYLKIKKASFAFPPLNSGAVPNSNKEQRHLAITEPIKNLISMMLELNPEKRITAKEVI